MTETPREASILLVDDRPNFLTVLRALLEPLGHRLESASTLERALALLLGQPFDLLICDVRMPQLDGFGIARLLRSNPRTAGLPILFISGDPAALARARREVAGPVACLEKPFRAEALWAEVRALLGAPPP